MRNAALPRIALALVLAAAATASAREQLRVRATAELTSLALVRGSEASEVSGRLVDEVGAAITGAEVSLLAPEAMLAHAAPCRSPERVAPAGRAFALTTDASGAFCIHVPTDENLEGTTLSYSGDTFHLGARAALPKASDKRRILLSFESPSIAASLDAPSFDVSVTARTADDALVGDPIRLVLSHVASAPGAQETELGATDVTVGSAARFDVETHALGAARPGKLIVRFAGTGSLGKSDASTFLELHATAQLNLAAPIAPSDPSDGVELLASVSSVTGAVTDGWVEAMIGVQSVGLAPVVAGAARVVATFSPSRGRAPVVSLRYVSASGAYVAGAPLVVEIPLRPGNPWPSVPWLVVAFAITYFVVRAWKRPPRTDRPREDGKSVTGHGIAQVEVVATDATHSGWRGRVIDAHDGAPVAGARVSIVVPAFDGEGIAASHVVGADGAFALVHVEAARNEGARLVVTAPYHATLSGPTPPDGILTVCLLSRRRALLDRLVGWAGKAGRPWARRKEPTPLELAEVARSRRDEGVANWATAIAEAAYGPKPPDERREREIVGREPLAPAPSGGRDER